MDDLIIRRKYGVKVVTDFGFVPKRDDLISRAAAIEAAIDGADDWDGGCNQTREEYIREHMAKVPTVDAVPVVRCKDCKFRDLTRPYPVCRLDSADPCELTRNADEDDWFCADGERRDKA